MTAQWAITYHANSRSLRSKKWYRVTRVIQVEGEWYELYWHPDMALRGNNRADIETKAKAFGLELVKIPAPVKTATKLGLM